MNSQLTKDVKKDYIGGFDIVKIIASILIVLHHYQMFFGFWFDGKLNFNNGAFYFGFIVELFFMISGALIYHSNKGKGLPDFGTYFIKKYSRFFPMCFITITVFTLLQWIYCALFDEFFFYSVGVWNYLSSIFLVNKGWGINAGVPANNPTWYICILLICYIWYWIINKVCSKWKLPANAFYILMIFVGINIRTKEWEVGLFCGETARAYIAFFLGIILYQVAMKYKEILRFVCPAILLGFILIQLRLRPTNWYLSFRDDLYYIIVFVYYPLIFLSAASMHLFAKAGNNRIIPFLSKVSFEVYLWHFPLLGLFQLIIRLGNLSIQQNYVTMGLFVFAVFVFSVFVYKFIETPINGWVTRRINAWSNENK